MKTKITLPHHPWRQLALIDPRLDHYTWVDWLNRNCFILSAITVLLVYVGYFRRTHPEGALRSLVVRLLVGYAIAPVESPSPVLQRTCKRRQVTAFRL